MLEGEVLPTLGRPLVAFSAAAIAATIAGNFVPAFLPWVVLAVPVGAAAALSALTRDGDALPFWVLAGFTAGIFATGVSPQSPSRYGGRVPVRFEVTVRDGWSTTEHGWRTRVALSRVTAASKPVRAAREVTLFLGGLAQPEDLPPPGSRWVGAGELVYRAGRPLQRPLLSVKSRALLQPLAGKSVVDWGRQWLWRGLERSAGDFPNLRKAAAVAAALVLGRRESLEVSDVARLRASGLAHLLAVSGLHVGLVGALAWAILLVLGVPPNWRRGLLILVVLGFAVLAGAAPPVRRAAGAMLLYLAARMAGRPLTPLPTAWAVVATLVLLEPTAALEASLAISAVVTLALVRWADPLTRRLRPLPRKVAGPIAVATIAQGASLPLVGGIFGAVPWLALPINLVAAPIALALVAGSVTAVALAAAAGNLARVALYPLAWAQTALNTLAGLGAPMTSACASVPPLAALACGAVALVALSRSRAAGAAAAVVVAATVAWVLVPRFLPAGGSELRALPVRDGMAVLARQGHVGILFDAGRGERDAARALASLPVRNLAAIVLTHADADHIGGVAAVLRQHRVEALVYPSMMRDRAAIADLLSLARQRRVRRIAVARGQSLSLHQARLDVLWPPLRPAGLSDNDASLVARLRLAGITVLITGDLETKGERWLMRGSGPLAADILQVPHHGSTTSSCQQFLARVRPRLAVVACGVRPRFSFPAAEVVGRLRRNHSVVLAQSRGVSRVIWTDPDSVVIPTSEPVTVHLAGHGHG